MPYEARVTQSHTSNGSVANSSNVTVTFQVRRTDYAMIGYNYEGTAYWRINCDGQSTGNKYFTFDWNYHPQNQWWTVGSHTFTVPHNSDGSKHIGFDGYYYTGISPSDLGASGSATLTKIARYAKITSFKNTSSTITSATFSWTADSSCNSIEYSLNNGSWVGTSGSSFTISNLTPETTYNIKIRVRRSDSGLYTESNNISFSTKSLTRIINTPLEMNIGGNLLLKFENWQNNAVYLRFEIREPGGRWQQVTSVYNIQAASYNWNLSNYSSRMYQLCKDSNYIEISVIYGIIINGKDYHKGAYGKAFVMSGSEPAFTSFSFMNTDFTTSNIVGNTQNMLCLFGNLRVSIPSADKAIANNGATMSHYNIAVSSGNFVTSKTVSYSLGDVDVDFGSFQAAGSYTIRVDAVDSRGYSSGIVSRTFTVYPYHTPSIIANIKRLNGFEAETSLSLNVLLSQINIAGSIKNSLQKIEYRYAESGTAFPSSYTRIYNYNTSQSGNDIVISVEDPNFITLDINKTYLFEFKVTDRICPYTVTPTVNQGVSVLNVLDNGNILVGVAPTQENVTDTKANILTKKDIKSGDRYVMEEIDKILPKVNEDLSSVTELVKNLYLLIHPVGSIVMTTENSNPGDTFGGTWEAWGSGRVPVGVDDSITEFNQVEKIGGESKHWLSNKEIPSHSHAVAPDNWNAHTFAWGDGQGGNIHAPVTVTPGNAPSGQNYLVTKQGRWNVTGLSGSGEPHNNLQPYITCYMWKRTA